MQSAGIKLYFVLFRLIGLPIIIHYMLWFSSWYHPADYGLTESMGQSHSREEKSGTHFANRLFNYLTAFKLISLMFCESKRAEYKVQKVKTT